MRIIPYFKDILGKPIQQSKKEDGFALILTVVFMVVVGLFVSRNFDMVANNYNNQRSLRANSFLGKQAVSAVGMAKKLFTPPWKIPCGMARNANEQIWACPALFPDPFICDQSSTTIVPIMSPSANAHWQWKTRPHPHLNLRLPLIVTGLRENKWKATLNGGYGQSDFATSLVLPGKLRCKKNGAGQVVQNFLTVTTIAKYKDDEVKQNAIFPIVPPPPKCILKAAPGTVHHEDQYPDENKPIRDWVSQYGTALTHDIIGHRCPDGATCPPSALESYVVETLHRPPYFEHYKPYNIALSLQAYGIFTGGHGGPLPDLEENYSLRAKISKSIQAPTPQTYNCSDITFEYTLEYPLWLKNYLATPVNKLPRWAQPFALDPSSPVSNAGETCHATVKFAVDWAILRVKECPPPPEITIIPGPGDPGGPTPVPGAPEQFDNGLSIGYDNDGNITVTDPSEN